ncbi:hypothetical protein H5410_016847 [Solanum commersonii]|uniref:Ulp1 protease family, C-terminal catalytic domain containing protein n=1 Tax=Solanum commersonii TaxID=4109 RepID=A0A9J5ZYV4_SOLCO|nr:hypothetical protein H5410_016847 [Solanum commersonii]
MSTKIIVTPRKSPRLVEGTSTDEVHAPTFNILTQIPPSKNDQKEKKNEAKKRVSPANQNGKKRKGKIVEIPSDSNSDFVSEIKKKKEIKKATNVEVAQSSKSSTRRTTKKKESEILISEKGKKIVRVSTIFNLFSHYSDCGLYTCLFAEYISNGVFDMRSVDIDAKYHCQSESEVTGTVASKFGGPDIAKEHAPDTSNYPTPRPRKRNLR